jgi:hypothetical protein
MFLRVLAAAALCAVTVCICSPAQARNHHRHHAHHESVRSPHKRRLARSARVHRQYMETTQRTSQGLLAAFGFAGDLVSRARAYIGRTGPSLGLPARLWCSDFMNMITGGGTGSRLARSWLQHQRVSPSIGTVAVMGRRGGGHVGVVSGFKPNGDVILVSGNFGGRVGEGVIRRSRVIAFVSP